MDIDPKLFGAYAGVYLKERAKCVDSLNKEKAKWADFAALHKKKNIKFVHNTETKRETRLSAMKENEKKRRSDLFMNSRKTDMAKVVADELDDILHEETGVDEISTVEIVVDTTTTTTTTEKSKTKTVIMESSSTALNSNSNSNKVLANGNKSTVTTAGNNNVNVNNLKNGSSARGKPQQPQVKPIANVKKTAEDVRREKLLKWKKEKEMATQVAKKNERQPFKVGVVAPAAQNRVHPTTTTAAPVNQSMKNGKVGNPPETRRVTRAMAAKTQPAAPSTSRNATTSAPTTTSRNGMTFNFTKAANANKAVDSSLQQKFKTLNVKDKPSTSSAPPSGPSARNVRTGPPLKPGQSVKPQVASASTAKTATAAARKGPTQTMPPRVPVSGKLKEKTASSSSSNVTVTKSNNPSKHVKATESSTKSRSNSKSPEVEQIKPAAAAEVKVKKRAKAKGFDPVFIDFNGKLSSSCSKLNQYSDQWHKILDESVDLSEKIQGDIRSSLGKVKLLLDSKLPQFWELLDAYVRQEGGPEGSSQVLPCDLQGWWDVASIQLEIVDEVFKSLTALKENNWETPVEPVQSAKPDVVTVKVSPKHRPPLAPRAPKPVNVKASSGLKAFLAQKRQMAKNPDGVIDMDIEANANIKSTPNPVTVINKTPMKPVPENEDSEFNKTFDGGFFSVQSPKPKPSTTPSSRRLQELRQSGAGLMSPPPNRRSSTASQRRISMAILGVRRSLGPLSKIGVPAQQEDGINDSLDSSNRSHVSSHTTEEMVEA